MDFPRTVSASFTRPANTTQYASGDIVANHATGASVVPMEFEAARYLGGNGRVKGVSITASQASITTAVFRLHLFTAAPTVTNGDNGALAITNGRVKGYLGHVDVTLDQLVGDGAHGRAACDIQFDTEKPAKKLYGLLEARDTYTPASAQMFDVRLECERD